MRTLKLLSWSIVVVGLAAAAYAQGMRGGGSYNPATEATLTGTVDEVKTMPSSGKGGGGVHFMLNTGTGTMTVHVGPASFVSSKNFALAKGDTLTVVGSRVTMEGQAVLIAREIKKGEQVLTLRDAKGFPLWSGRGGTE